MSQRLNKLKSNSDEKFVNAILLSLLFIFLLVGINVFVKSNILSPEVKVEKH